jgi:hypothetical protein
MDASAWQVIVSIFGIIVGIIMSMVNKKTKILPIVGIILIFLSCIVCYYGVRDISSQQAPATPPSATSTSTLPPEMGGKTSPTDNPDKNTATPTAPPNSTPTPTPQPTATPTTELTFGETVSGYITTTTTSNMYSVVLTQAGRLTLNLARDSEGPFYLSIKMLDTDGVKIVEENNKYLGGMMVSFNFPYSKSVPLESGTYYIEISKPNTTVTVGPTGGVYYLNVDVSYF